MTQTNFVILRRDYLEVTGDYCAAKLIDYFKKWTHWKFENHRTEWVYQPIRRIWDDLLREHSQHVIRRAIAILEDIGLLSKRRNPGNGQDKTWQYKLNQELLKSLLEHGKSETEHSEFKNEHSEFNVEQHHRINTNTSNHSFDPVENNNIAVEETLDEQEELDQEQEITPTAPSKAEISTPTIPTKTEINQACSELRGLRINPEPCLGVIKKYWGNVAGAIARVKEAINEGWCSNPTGLFINSCKTGEKPKNTVTSDVRDWFNWARQQRIVAAMTGGMVYDHDGNAHEIEEMMQQYPIVQRE